MHTENRAAYQTFTHERTREILKAACQRSGIECSDAELLRHQSNAVYLLRHAQIVVKIARPESAIEDIRRTVDLTRWLMELQFPTVPICDINQPLIVDGSAVTFWQYLPQKKPISAADIAAPLRMLHHLPMPPRTVVQELPQLDAISAIRYSLDRQGLLSDDERIFLLRRCAYLEAALTNVSYERADCLIHGDPQHRNTLWSGRQAVLCDWESACIGPVEWDLVTIEVHCRRFGHPPETYREFCRIYGRDIRAWEGFTAMRDVRELRMITTNARKSAPGSPSAAEVRRRIAELQEGAEDLAWSIL